jgi:hypothetical protein
LFYIAPLLLLKNADYLKTFSHEQLNTLVLLSLKLYDYGTFAPTVFYGAAWVILGYLVIKSGYLPKIFGILLLLGGLGFVARSFALIVAPIYASSYLLLPLAAGGVLLAVWLLVRGVNGKKWQERTTARA